MDIEAGSIVRLYENVMEWNGIKGMGCKYGTDWNGMEWNVREI